jgi:RNA polymerase sigma-70 factor (ECF subfamily)
MNTAAVTAPSADDYLIRQVANGDEQAFAELYQAHGRAVYNYLLRLVNEPAVAEELLQEVFLAMWQGARNFREQARVKTWLLRIAHHQAVSWLRRHHAQMWLDDAAEVPVDDLLDDRLQQGWQADQLRRALAQLSAKHRAVIELAFVHELSYAEIADVMRCPIGTVKSRMSYALRHLGDVLKTMPLDE